MSHAGSFIEVRVGSCRSYCGNLAHEVTHRALLCILGSCFHTLTTVGTLSPGCIKARVDSAASGEILPSRGGLSLPHLYLCKFTSAFLTGPTFVSNNAKTYNFRSTQAEFKSSLAF